MIPIECPACNKVMDATEDMVGLTADCIYCGETIEVNLPAYVAPAPKVKVVEVVKNKIDPEPVKKKKISSTQKIFIALSSLIVISLISNVVTYMQLQDAISDISDNRSGISDNESGIRSNDYTISKNKSAISDNEYSISDNESAISTNEFAISSNDRDISTNEGAISSHKLYDH